MIIQREFQSIKRHNTKYYTMNNRVSQRSQRRENYIEQMNNQMLYKTNFDPSSTLSLVQSYDDSCNKLINNVQYQYESESDLTQLNNVRLDAYCEICVYYNDNNTYNTYNTYI